MVSQMRHVIVLVIPLDCAGECGGDAIVDEIGARDVRYGYGEGDCDGNTPDCTVNGGNYCR